MNIHKNQILDHSLLNHDQKLKFENLTLAPLERDLINFKKLNKSEKDYLFKYHLEVYSKLSMFLSKNEKKWLASFLSF